MKFKQFFVDNKDKINTIFENVLVILIFIVIVFSVYACGFYQGSYLESSEESNKKELVNRKEAVNFNHDINFKVFTLSEDSSLIDIYLYGHDGNLGLNLYSDVYLTDNGILFNYNYKVNFGNGSYIYYPSSTNNLLLSYDNVGYDLTSYFNDSTISLSLYVSSYTLPYVVEGSQSLVWELGFEYELYISYESDLYFYFESFITLDIQQLVADDIWFTTNDAWISYFQSISFDDDFETLKSGIFYSGTNPYYFYSHSFDIGYQDGQPKNIFYYDVEKDSPYLLVLDDTAYIRPDDYDENLLFKNNYLDLQYLRSLYSNQYSKFRIIFTDSIYSLKDLYLSLDNSSLNDYNILVNGKAYSINSSGTLNIPSFELLQVMEFDSSLLDSTRLINASPDYANGFNNGYENGYSNGYSEGEIDQEVYYEDLIIPSIKTEYYDLGLADGRAENNAILKPFELIAKGVEPVILVLSSEIAPGITIGTIALIPLAVTMIVFLLKGLVL